MQPLVQTIQRDSAITFPMLGNLTINPPSYFTVFGMDIYFYGVIIGLGFILGILYCSHNSRRFGIDQDSVYDVMIWLIPTAIIGARLYYVLFRLDYYVQHPNEIFAIHNGGLAIYGGVIAGVLVIWLVCRKKEDTARRDARPAVLRPADRADTRPLGQLYEPRGFRRGD